MCTEVESRLKDKLPHGSGINGNWSIETHKKHSNILFASNCFEAMNESGMYCHNYDFTVKVKYNGIGQYKPCHLCLGNGKRNVSELMQYHPNMYPMQMIERLVIEQNIPVFYRESGNVDSAYFTCNYCNGFGKIPLHEFEFISLNFHDQHEYSCCGYEMKSYISDAIAESLTFDN